MMAFYVSCTSESDPLGEMQESSVVHINFQTSVHISAVSKTRSFIDGAQLPSDLSVGLYAKPVGESAWGASSIKNKTLLSDDAGGLTPGIEAKAFVGSSYDFYAYSPHSSEIEFDAQGQPCLPIVIEPDIKSQQDILYAYKQASLSGKTVEVPLVFQHVLSRVQFFGETPKTQFNSSYGPVINNITIQTSETQSDCVLNLETGMIQEKADAIQNTTLTQKCSSKILTNKSRLQLAQFAMIPSKIISITVNYTDEDKRPGTKTFSITDLSGGIEMQAGHIQPIILHYDNKKITLRKPEISGEVIEWKSEEEDHYQFNIQ